MRKLKSLYLKTLGVAALALGMGMANAADKPTLKIGFVNGWDDSVAASYVAGEILKEKLGYGVELKPVEPAIMWQGVARGDLDATLSAWLPATHGEYFEKLKDKVVVLGSNYKGAKIGLIVPDYVQAKSIEDLNTYKADFDGKITGIDAGAGVMRRTEDAIKQYNLDIKLMPSSGPAMATALTRAEKAQKPIVVTGWIPHWMFAKWKLRFLEDPKKVYGDDEHVDTVVNPGLEAKAADATAFLKKFSWSGEEVGAVMLAIREGAKPEAAAKEWIAKNPQRVEEWLK
ncbi:glycine betaine ABC transporter substrate-binding protein [Pseudomonas sp. JS3066]|jgi:glycine betaine/proline transport system substrate-binding protein|uniref:glycine betaine ABC transporter substrate-binding protein n=1 Tax=unclassified Pseudomonas TaxID=196821 RepID=UPI000EA9B716|nr:MULTISPECIES: glycine betaine ABC transporter substrate-binding protein [unclassified Pseudomonas]AYF88981.1 glycine betaine ABC transporter substrate-binding protein [Pseudomonas sp. DY-1]MDH4653174.1 glycine betaine ABC transporter substrate-binding protein [Pseudomonas sp. BN606]MRK21104.1 glycine betaine ABC transporter substrate-binding protein [Pseudomonas sp. JG-B]WVK93481.1 glycine betaine ABC transporter substrate-binding protein [Pseudomonas sp. JS3066]